MGDQQIEALNKITAIIDEKAAKYKDELAHMPRVRATAEKKLIIDLIDEGLSVAEQVRPKPLDLMQDLGRLKKQLQNLR